MALVTGTPSPDVLPLTAGDTVVGAAGHDTFVFDPTGASGVTTIGDFGGIYFGGPVTGAQETSPPGGTGSAASGVVEAYLIRGGAALVFDSSVTGLDFTGAQTPGTAADNLTAVHFHDAPVGLAGGVVFGFFGLPFNDTDGDVQKLNGPGVGGGFRGEWDAGEGNAGATLTSKIPDLLNNEIYINYHTTMFPAGEIRGQLIKQDDGLDRIDVSRANIGSFETMQVLLNDVGGSAQFTVWEGGRSHTVILSRVPEASLSAADFIFAGAVNQQRNGGSQRDDLFGAGGDDDLDGGGGADRLFGEAGDDELNGGSGDDLLIGGAGNDKADGESDNDSVSGGAGHDTLAGGSGEDTVAGDAGNDRARGESGDDSVTGGDGHDTLLGGGDQDTLDGGAGDDWLQGEAGHDWILGGAGNDQLFGQSGEDTLNGGLGNDTMSGGGAADDFVAGPGADVIIGFNQGQGDQVLIATGTAFTLSEVGGSTVVDLGGGSTLTLQGVAQDELSAGWFVFV